MPYIYAADQMVVFNDQYVVTGFFNIGAGFNGAVSISGQKIMYQGKYITF